MCGGAPSMPAPRAVVPQEAKQVASTPAGGLKKKNNKQQTQTGGLNTTPTMLAGTAGIGDDALNLGGKTILGG
mgnify:FL=1